MLWLYSAKALCGNPFLIWKWKQIFWRRTRIRVEHFNLRVTVTSRISAMVFLILWQIFCLVWVSLAVVGGLTKLEASFSTKIFWAGSMIASRLPSPLYGPASLVRVQCPNLLSVGSLSLSRRSFISFLRGMQLHLQAVSVNCWPSSSPSDSCWSYILWQTFENKIKGISTRWFRCAVLTLRLLKRVKTPLKKESNASYLKIC